MAMVQMANCVSIPSVFDRAFYFFVFPVVK